MKAFICALSDVRKEGEREEIDGLSSILLRHNVSVVHSRFIYTRGTGKQKAAELNSAIAQACTLVLDVSGGDSAHEVLPYLDSSLFKSSHALFCGYSDLSCVVDTIAQEAGVPALLFQARNITRSPTLESAFFDFITGKDGRLTAFPTTPVRAGAASGVLIGGNTRCTLKCHKLDFKGRILLLEAYSGDAARIAGLFHSYAETGAFEEISGLILGTFTQADRLGQRQDVIKSALALLPPSTPVYETSSIGHGVDSMAALIGTAFHLGQEKA